MNGGNRPSQLSRRSVLKTTIAGGLGAGALVASGVGTAAAACPIFGCGVIVNDTPLYAEAVGQPCTLRYIEDVLEAGTEVHVYDCCGGSTPTAYRVVNHEIENGWIEASDVESCDQARPSHER